jgi:preprotein translocase subunit SecA
MVDGRPDLGALAARIPTATWAYTVTDNSLGTELERIGRGIWRR